MITAGPNAAGPRVTVDPMGQHAPARARRPFARVGGRDVRLAALAALSLVTVYACWLLARPFLGPLTWAGVLALVLRGLHRWIARRVRRPSLAAGLAVAVVAVAIVLPLAAVGAAVVHEARKSAHALRSGELRSRWDSLKGRYPRLAPVFARLEQQAKAPGGGAPEDGGGQGGAQAKGAEATAGGGGGASPGGLSGALSDTLRGGMEFLLTFFILFFFFRDADRVTAALRDLLPMTRRRAERVLRRVGDAVWAITYGTLVVAAVQGALGGVMFWVLGLPAPVLWGVVMALLALVPVLGPFVVWVPAAAFLAMEGQWGKAVAMTAFGAVIIGLVDNVLYPSLVGDRLRLHTLVVFLSMLGGLSLFGASGLFLGPAILTFAIELRRVWRGRSGTRAGEAATRSQ
jgi:predicted PurR-regulated permease PerM